MHTFFTFHPIFFKFGHQQNQNILNSEDLNTDYNVNACPIFVFAAI